ncbi:MarR family winged helix-turn-helix transcriptional regulator [Streptomyces caatingaensis]|uniref:MarR family winged helix-turn-helix transcriptional regulator n=1 Tax=Streptomyces caatingaensis TaxID=1678637 RepID=UPI0012FF1CD7|nr:MarR family winged helix-turn-helix transcriptional regulator [Streptomyces caatingaensis]
MRDHVDDIQSAWAAELPDLDVSSIGVIGRVLELARRLERHRALVLAELGTDFPTLDVISALLRSGPPYRLSAGTLQRASLVTAGAISQRLERVKAAGLVRRVVDPVDKRRTVVALTPAGKRLADRALRELMEREGSLLDVYTPEEHRQLTALMRRWTVWFDRTAGPANVHPPRAAK